MTRAFVSFWKEKFGCEACLRIPGKRMCNACKRRALLSWHRYVAQRVTEGLCIQCPRKPLPNQQRCRKCAEVNRERCLEWSRTEGKKRMQARREAGVCLHHPKRKAAEGSCFCAPCRVRRRGLRLGLYVPEKRPYKFLSLTP